MRKFIRVFASVSLLFMGQTAFSQCTTVDQSQLVYNGGMSARNLPGYSSWQSFTAGTSGILCQIDIGFFNPMTGNGIFNFFEGEGIGGNLLHTDSVSITGTGNFFFSFPLSTNVAAGAVYTFQFIPVQGGGLPDPYGVQIVNPGAYPGGEMKIIDPSGTSSTGFDMIFKTYVELNTAVGTLEYQQQQHIFPNPVSDYAFLSAPESAPDGIWEIIDITGKILRKIRAIPGQKTLFRSDDFAPGIYIAQFKHADRIIVSEKLIVLHQ